MNKIKIWIKFEDYFVDETNIRSVRKNGNTTVIERIVGDPIQVKIDYNKVKEIIKPSIV